MLTEESHRIEQNHGPLLDVAAIESPAAAAASLDPMRARLLAELKEPGSASTLAAHLNIPRQKVNYHLRTLEQHGLIELVEERRKGNCTERILQSTANSYVISPAALPTVQPDPARAPDRLSARWLLALAARLVRDVGSLLRSSQNAGKPVSTFAVDGEVKFASAADRSAFADELSLAITTLVAKYHTENGRAHRLVLAVHPSVPETAIAPERIAHPNPQEP